MVLVGCATPPLPADPAALAPPPREVAWQVSVQPHHTVVEATFIRPGADPIELSMPDWDGVPLADDVHDVHAWVETGRGVEALPVRADERGRWTVSGFGERDFKLRYVVVGRRVAPETRLPAVAAEGQDAQEAAWVESDGAMRRSWTGAEHFMGWGRSLFLAPGLPDDAPPWESFRVDVRAPEGWSLNASWGRLETGARRFSDLRNALLVAGQWETERGEAAGSLLQVALLGGERWGSAAQATAIRRLVKRLVTAQATYMGGFPRSGVLISVVPAPAERAGVVVRPGGAVFALPHDLNPDKDVILVRDLAQAHFRLWTESLMMPRLELTPGSAYRPGHLAWFTEGLTEYYALRTLLSLKLVEAEDFLPLLNGWIKTYYADPTARALTRAEVIARYMEEPRLQALAQSKGMILALLMDIELRADSQGLKTLDLAMRVLLMRVGGRTYTTDDVREAVESFSGRSWAEFFTRYVDGAEALPLYDMARGGVLVLELPFPIYDLGFETSGDRFEGATVIVVNPGSEAERAGVKVGDVVQSVRFTEGRIDVPVQLALERPGSRTPVTLNFLPTRDVDIPVATELTELFFDWFRR